MLRALHIANCCTLTYPAVECPPLDSPTDGSLTQTGKFYGDSATYTCNPGFTLNGKETLNCQADSTWNGDLPTCFKCKMTYTLTETVSHLNTTVYLQRNLHFWTFWSITILTINYISK